MKSDGKSINRQQRKPTFNERNRQSTINTYRQSPTVADRFTYLLSAARTSTSKMADNIPNDNSKHSTTIGNAKTIYPKSKDNKLIAK